VTLSITKRSITKKTIFSPVSACCNEKIIVYYMLYQNFGLQHALAKSEVMFDSLSLGFVAKQHLIVNWFSPSFCTYVQQLTSMYLVAWGMWSYKCLIRSN